MKIGYAIANRRIELGISQEELAKAVGVSKSSICRWESGNISNMRRDRIYKLAEALKISPLDLLKNETDGFHEKENTASREDAKSRIDKIIQKKDIAELIQLEEIANQLPEQDIEDLLHYAELLLLKQKVQTDKEDQSDV